MSSTTELADLLNELSEHISEAHRWAQCSPQQNEAILDCFDTIHEVLKDLCA